MDFRGWGKGLWWWLSGYEGGSLGAKGGGKVQWWLSGFVGGGGGFGGRLLFLRDGRGVSGVVEGRGRGGEGWGRGGGVFGGGG